MSEEPIHPTAVLPAPEPVVGERVRAPHPTPDRWRKDITCVFEQTGFRRAKIFRLIKSDPCSRKILAKLERTRREPLPSNPEIWSMRRKVAKQMRELRLMETAYRRKKEKIEDLQRHFIKRVKLLKTRHEYLQAAKIRSKVGLPQLAPDPNCEWADASLL